MWLSVLFADTRRDDSPGLTFPVREVTTVVDDDVAGFTGGLGAYDALYGHNFSGERRLVLESVDRNSGLIIIGLGLKEILFGSDEGAEKSVRYSCRGSLKITSK